MIQPLIISNDSISIVVVDANEARATVLSAALLDWQDTERTCETGDLQQLDFSLRS